MRDIVIIEATWLGYFEPHEIRQVSSFIHDMMIRNNQTSFIESYKLHPFNVLVLQPQRTICEKIMSLVRFSYSGTPIESLQKKIRHLYDLYKLFQDETLSYFFNSKEFEKMMVKVGSDDSVSYKNNNDWLKHHPKDALLFANSEATWQKLSALYETEFMDLVFDRAPPSSDQVLQTILLLRTRLSSVAWNIGI